MSQRSGKFASFLALATGALAGTNCYAQATVGTSEVAQVETVVVTAEKRTESARDVPMALTALSGEQLARTQSYAFEDYVGTVPGLTLIDNGGQGSQLVVRGLTTGTGAINSSVATYIDETPYGVEGIFASSYLAAPNLDTFDMQRIEVLKGPQGTLYGANALGGLLKYVTNAPDPSGFAASVESGVSSVYNGGVGFDVHGMVNIPLASDVALRLVGYDNYYPGFIDDPSRGLKDINGSHFTGGRASLLYQPTADFSIRFNALYQERSYSDWPDEDVNPGTLTPIYCSLCQERLVSQPGYSINQLYNMTVNWDVGFAKLVSTTSFQALQVRFLLDDSDVFGPTLTGIFGTPLGGALPEGRPSHSWTQEVRLSSPDTGPLQWQLGGFFTDEAALDYDYLDAVDATTKTLLPYSAYSLLAYNVPVTYREYAVFANLDYHITPTFDVAAGGRYSENSQAYTQMSSGLFNGPADDFTNKSSQGVFTYSGDARWHITPDAMLYARIATGYVPGGPNDVVPGAGSLDNAYSSSTTTNYEAGIKSSLLDNSLTVEVSAYHIEWHDIQLLAYFGGIGSITNGGGAQSDGVEWNFAYVPVSGLTLGFNGAYDDAYLTTAAPASVGGQAGSRLPNVPLWESSASAEYERPLFGDYSGFAGVNWRFSGSRLANFEASSPRQDMPSYAVFDLRVGIESQGWTFALYAKNVGNEIAINSLQDNTIASGGFGPQAATVTTPRTIGATLTANF